MLSYCISYPLCLHIIIKGELEPKLPSTWNFSRCSKALKNSRWKLFSDAGVGLTPRLTTSAPASRKTSRKESKLVDYIYSHQSDGIARPKSQISGEIIANCQGAKSFKVQIDNYIIDRILGSGQFRVRGISKIFPYIIL